MLGRERIQNVFRGQWCGWWSTPAADVLCPGSGGPVEAHESADTGVTAQLQFRQRQAI